MKQAKFIIYPRYDQLPCIQLQLIVINCGLPHSNEYTVLVYAKTRLIGKVNVEITYEILFLQRLYKNVVV